MGRMISRRMERWYVPGRHQAEGAVSHGSAAPLVPLPQPLEPLELVLPSTRGTRAEQTQLSASDAQFCSSWTTEAGETPMLVGTGRPLGHAALPSKGRVGELPGYEVIRSHCPVRGNSNFYERLNDNTSL